MPTAIHPSTELPPGRPLSLLGVEYTHFALGDGSELFVTEYGLPFADLLRPENWLQGGWFEQHSTRLAGTSAVYRLSTRRVDGRELELVVKWSRVGEQVPLDTFTLHRFLGAEFNSPFEEFSLLMELRRTEPGARILTKKPLAIYAPSQRMQAWQSGRSEHIIRAKVARHPTVELDLLRQYVVIFQWVKGLDLVQAAEKLGLGGARREEFLAQHTTVAIHELELRGFRVLDMKPAHVIVRFRKDGHLLRNADGQLAYALVDYELLEHTPEKQRETQSVARHVYLGHLAQRFHPPDLQLPPNLRAVRVDGLDYLAGRTESTGGMLFVLGRDPELFNYFLPERWRRTPSEGVRGQPSLRFTRTKDKLPVLWEIAESTGPGETGQNPFQRFARLLDRQRSGVQVLSPRALYFPKSSASLALENRTFANALSSAELIDALPESFIALWGFLDYIPAAESVSAWSGAKVMSLAEAVELGLVRRPPSPSPDERGSLPEDSHRPLVVVGPGNQVFHDGTGQPLVLLRD